MARRLTLLLTIALLATAAPAQTFFPIFSENFETGMLGAFVETDVAGIPTPTLWHGEGACSPPTVPPGPPTDLLFTPSGGTYTVTQTTPAFTSIAGTPGAIPIIPTGTSAVVTGPIPRFMPFTFFGVSKTWVQISVEGWMAFDQTLTSSSSSNQGIPNSGNPNDMLAPWWDDLHTGALGTVWLGINFGNKVTVEWNSVERSPGNGSGEIATFQVILNPAPVNTIEFHYDHAGFSSGTDPWNASVGIEDATGTVGINPTPNGNMNGVFPNIGGTPAPNPVPAVMGMNAAAYNQGDIGVFTFNTGAANEGGIQSPMVSVGPPTTTLRLRFDYLKDTENSLSFDQCFVQASPGATGTWNTVTQLPAILALCSGPPLATTVGPNLPNLDALVTSGGGRFRFFFDSVDSVANDGLGWYVDNVVFEGNGPGGLLLYGTGCPGSGGAPPTIAGSGPPQIGTLGFSVNLSGTIGGTSAFLILGASDQTWLGFTLPLNLAIFGAPACSLLASADALFSTATGPGGTASQTLPIPNLPGLVGVSAFTQWGVIDPGAPGALPLSMSRGLKITFF